MKMIWSNAVSKAKHHIVVTSLDFNDCVKVRAEEVIPMLEYNSTMNTKKCQVWKIPQCMLANHHTELTRSQWPQTEFIMSQSAGDTT